MDRFFCCMKNCLKPSRGPAKRLLACALVLFALLAGTSAALEMKRETAQPVFFSLLFPQLALEPMVFECGDACWWEAMFL